MISFVIILFHDKKPESGGVQKRTIRMAHKRNRCSWRQQKQKRD